MCCLVVLYVVLYVCAATVVLDSSVACPGEMVTYTYTVRQGAVLDWIIEPFLPVRIQFLLSILHPLGAALSVSAVNCANFDFVATLTNVTNRATVTGASVADMTSTLTFITQSD